MKKILGLLVGLVLATYAVKCFADPHGTGSGLLWQGIGQTQTVSYVQDLNNTGEIVSAQINYSSATIASVTVGMTAFALNGTVVTGSNKFTTAIPVLYTSTVTVGGLTTGTTYYASGSYPAGTSPTFQLSTTSTGSVAGSYITFTSTTSGTGYSLTFAPLAPTGSAGFTWYVSNDNVNFVTVSVSSVTFSTPYTASTVVWNFGALTQRYLKLIETPPTTGSINYTVWFNQGTNYVGN